MNDQAKRDTLNEALTALGIAEGCLRKLALVQNVRDPIEKHQNTTGKDFTRYADDANRLTFVVANTFACAEEWRERERKSWADAVEASNA